MGAAIPWGAATALPDPQALDFWAVLLAVVGAIYVGSALGDGRLRIILTETGVALAFLALTLAGLWQHPWFLVVGWAAHGLWDVGHHGEGESTWSAPVEAGFYPLACLSFDLVVALAIAVRFL